MVYQKRTGRVPPAVQRRPRRWRAAAPRGPAGRPAAAEPASPRPPPPPPPALQASLQPHPSTSQFTLQTCHRSSAEGHRVRAAWSLHSGIVADTLSCCDDRQGASWQVAAEPAPAGSVGRGGGLPSAPSCTPGCPASATVSTTCRTALLAQLVHRKLTWHPCMH